MTAAAEVRSPEFVEEHILAGILSANSWRDLEEWIAEAERSYGIGDLALDQVDGLVAHAIQVSRGIPER